MTQQEIKRAAHSLSIVAAKVVRDSQLKPGIWDFEKAFAPYIELMDLVAKATEISLAASSAAAAEARMLYLLNRRLELENRIRTVRKQIEEIEQ